jgi:hypothetical protein
LNKFGYEFSLTKEFYVHEDAEPIEKILTDLKNIKKEIQILEKNLYE